MNDGAQQAPSKGRASVWKYAFPALLAAIVLPVIATTATLALAGKAFVRYGISSDLTECVQALGRAELGSALENEAIERLERIRGNARRGRHVGFWRWLGYEDSIRNACHRDE